MTNAPFAGIDEFRDLESVNHYHHAVAGGADPEAVLEALRMMGRDNARTPMQWDGSRHAGFTTGEPWLPVNPNHTEINAAAQRHDPDSVLAHYRRLIELRHSDPVVAHGDFTMLLPNDPQVYAFTRRLEDAGEVVELLVLGNVGPERAVAPVPDAAGWVDAELVLHNLGTRNEPEPASVEGVRLDAWECRVYRRTTRSTLSW